VEIRKKSNNRSPGLQIELKIWIRGLAHTSLPNARLHEDLKRINFHRASANSLHCTLLKLQNLETMKKPDCLFPPSLLFCRSLFALKPAFLACLLLVTSFIFSQSNTQLHHIKPKWKLGDQKRVHTESVSKIFIKDSLLTNTEATANYNIKVIDTVKSYTLLYSHESNSVDIQTKSSVSGLDSGLNFFTRIIKKIEKETNAFKYELLVDKNTGQAFKVKNEDEYLKMIQQAAATMIDEMGENKGKTSAQIDSMKQKVIAYFKLAEPKILATAINEFNYMMQPYSYTFPYNSTVSQKAMVHDVNALGEFGGIEMPAVITISSNQHGGSLTIETGTDYDKDFLLEQIKKKYKNMNELTTSDIFLSEVVETVFTTSNSWVVSHKSNVVFKIKEVKVINETTVSFQ
jgi:hypothetical protein